MKTLVDHVLSIENEAAGILEVARAEAKRIEQDAGVGAAALRAAAATDAAQRVAAFREAAREKLERDIAAAEAEGKRALAALEHIRGETIERQVQRVIARFREQ